MKILWYITYLVKNYKIYLLFRNSPFTGFYSFQINTIPLLLFYTVFVRTQVTKIQHYVFSLTDSEVTEFFEGLFCGIFSFRTFWYFDVFSTNYTWEFGLITNRKAKHMDFVYSIRILEGCARNFLNM